MEVSCNTAFDKEIKGLLANRMNCILATAIRTHGAVFTPAEHWELTAQDDTVIIIQEKSYVRNPAGPL